jgi:succinate dehydrogenase/fumarate reductase flavoprotein subunit
MVDKAAVDRSGAVAQGLSAIDTYIGENTSEDYVRMVHADLMGITRDDLIYDIGRHVDGTVHLFEEWGLPIWKTKETEGVAPKDGGKPVRTYMEHKDKTAAEDVNPYYIQPRNFQMRLQKIMDEYVAGISTYYQTNGMLLAEGLKYLGMLKEDSEYLRAKDLHELLRAWEIYHRLWAAELHLRHIQFREETRYPGFYYRADFPDLDEDNWHCFVNSRHDPDTSEWQMMKRQWTALVDHGH